MKKLYSLYYAACAGCRASVTRPTPPACALRRWGILKNRIPLADKVLYMAVEESSF